MNQYYRADNKKAKINSYLLDLQVCFDARVYIESVIHLQFCCLFIFFFFNRIRKYDFRRCFFFLIYNSIKTLYVFATILRVKSVLTLQRYVFDFLLNTRVDVRNDFQGNMYVKSTNYMYLGI